MFVEVIRLRAKGERLDRERLKQSTAVRGYLNVHQRFDHWVRISARRGRSFQVIVDGVSDERGRHFRLIVDDVSA